jgi:predicted nuclease of restriction endonuclease-like (RecB) superfamily
MVQFAEVFPDQKIVVSLLRQLGWTHFLRLIPIDDALKREFYAELCRVERWNTRTLASRIRSMLFERSALSKKPDTLIRRELASLRRKDRLTPDLVFRDPYFLDFLGLKDLYAEKDLEAAILRQMESFILELGVGFAFLERQKRVTVDGEDFHLDLLFFHRGMRRLVAVDLKLDAFQPGDKGQMECYLRWLGVGTAARSGAASVVRSARGLTSFDPSRSPGHRSRPRPGDRRLRATGRRRLHAS